MTSKRITWIVVVMLCLTPAVSAQNKTANKNQDKALDRLDKEAEADHGAKPDASPADKPDKGGAEKGDKGGGDKADKGGGGDKADKPNEVADAQQLSIVSPAGGASLTLIVIAGATAAFLYRKRKNAR